MSAINLDIAKEIGTLGVSSKAFAMNSYIPAKYTCDGENVNPALRIDNIPSGTKSLAIIVDDPDAPGRTFVHWVVWNILPVKLIKENSNPGVIGINDFKENRYSGPCPPSGTHHYHFKVYALDDMLHLPNEVNKVALEKAMGSHILAIGELVGIYKRSR